MTSSYLKLTCTKIQLTGVLLLICASFIAAQEMDNDVPMGWAVYPKYGMENTTGGGDGKVVTATSSGELKGYCTSSEPLVIIATGSFGGGLSVASNKTIIGGGSGATFKGGISLGSNNIIRNFKISGGSDCIAVNGNKHHIWIDHCDLSSCGDGLLDITNASDLITTSWTKFSDHNKVMLINNGKRNSDEIDKLNVTLHHNFFTNTVQRHPRVGYSEILILNNYYDGCKSYCIHTYWNCHAIVERNYFKDAGDAISNHKPAGGKGYAVLVDNIFDNSKYNIKSETDSANIFKVSDYYMYDWVVTDVKEVPTVVGNGVGTGEKWGKIGPVPTPGQGAVNISTSPTLKWTKAGTPSSSKVYFGKAFPPPEVKSVEGYSFKPGNLDKGTVYFWKINDGKVWKFRTEGPIADVRSPASANGVSKTATVLKGIMGQSVIVGVKKGGKNEKHYDMSGRAKPNPAAEKATKIKKD